MASKSQMQTEQHSQTEQPKAPRFRIKQRLTVPLYSMAHLASLICRADSEIFEADFNVEIPGKADSKPQVMRIWDIEKDCAALLILNTIMLSSLLRSGDKLEGRYFKFTSGGQRDGKQYRDIVVEELEMEL